MIADIKIDDEFRQIIPPLSDEEKAMLSNSIMEEGCRDPLVVWKGRNILLDGHNRYDICTMFEVGFAVTEREFKDRDEAKVWMIRNQMGRRNLTPFQRAELALELEVVISKAAKENQRRSGGRGNKGKQKSADLNPLETRREVARAAGVSHDTVAKVKAIRAEATPEVVEKVRSGGLSINAAWQQVRPPRQAPRESQQVDLPTNNPAKTAASLAALFDAAYLRQVIQELGRVLGDGL